MFKLKLCGFVLAAAVASGIVWWAAHGARHPGERHEEPQSAKVEQPRLVEVFAATPEYDQETDKIAEEKERIASCWIDQDISLVEAAAHFRCLNQSTNAASLAPQSPDESEDERLGREVLSWVRRRLQKCYPGAVDELIARYEEEFRRYKEIRGARQPHGQERIRITIGSPASPSR